MLKIYEEDTHLHPSIVIADTVNGISVIDNNEETKNQHISQLSMLNIASNKIKSFALQIIPIKYKSVKIAMIASTHEHYIRNFGISKCPLVFVHLQENGNLGDAGCHGGDEEEFATLIGNFVDVKNIYIHEGIKRPQIKIDVRKIKFL